MMEEANLDLRNLLSLLRRQAKLILAVAVAITAVAAMVLFTLTPVYSTSALVLIDASPKNLLDPTAATRLQLDDVAINSEMEIMQSDPVLIEVISEAGLISEPEFGVRLGLRDRILGALQLARPTLPTGQAALQRVLGNLREAISVNRRARTNLATLAVTSIDPETAARIANIWAKAYIESQVAAKIDSALQSRDALQARLETARANLVNSESSLDSFLDQNIAQIVEETGRTDIADLRDQLIQLEAQRGSSADRAKSLEQRLAARDWTGLVQSLQDQALAELERQRQSLAAQIDEGADVAAPNLRSELAGIEQQLLNAGTGELGNLRSAMSRTLEEENALRQQLRSAVLQSSLSPDILARIYELQQTAGLSRSQYQTMLSRIQDLEVQSTLQIADSRIVAEAMPPPSPSFPNVPILLAIAVAGSLLAGFLLAFLRENLIGGLQTIEQTEAVLRLPVAAAVPRHGGDVSGAGPADLVVTAIMSPLAESIRRIRAALELALRRRRSAGQADSSSGALTVMVTSSMAKEGKTTVAMALARTMAVAKRRVLLIDCDLRRPSVHERIGAQPDTSFGLFLAEELDAADPSVLFTRDPLSNAMLILASRSEDGATDHLVGGRALPLLLDRVRPMFDVVILDTPPVGPVVDGLYIAPLADFILFVVHSGSTSQAAAKASIAAINGVKRADTSMLAVLNQQDRVSASYSGQYSAAYQY